MLADFQVCSAVLSNNCAAKWLRLEYTLLEIFIFFDTLSEEEDLPVVFTGFKPDFCL